MLGEILASSLDLKTYWDSLHSKMDVACNVCGDVHACREHAWCRTLWPSTMLHLVEKYNQGYAVSGLSSPYKLHEKLE